MSEIQVLIVEDDEEIARLTTLYLEAEGYSVDVVHEGQQAVEKIKKTNPDLVLLDLMLPGLSGAEVCRQVRMFYKGIILVLTASADEMSEVSLFKFGADDYVTKPIRGHALLARIEALLRRTMTQSHPKAEDKGNDGIEINKTAHVATFKGQDLKLTAGEFEILNLLVTNTNQVVTREQCCQLFRGIDYSFNDRSIDMRVSGLRRKLRVHAQDQQLIRTVRNKGYTLAI